MSKPFKGVINLDICAGIRSHSAALDPPLMSSSFPQSLSRAVIAAGLVNRYARA
jgi:hypothetical protein